MGHIFRNITPRNRLPNRRPSITRTFEANGLKYAATYSYFANGDLAGSHSDFAAEDSAVVASLALQRGVPLETIRKALLRDPRGKPSSPLGAALDLVAEMEGER